MLVFLLLSTAEIAIVGIHIDFHFSFKSAYIEQPLYAESSVGQQGCTETTSVIPEFSIYY